MEKVSVAELDKQLAEAKAASTRRRITKKPLVVPVVPAVPVIEEGNEWKFLVAAVTQLFTEYKASEIKAPWAKRGKKIKWPSIKKGLIETIADYMLRDKISLAQLKQEIAEIRRANRAVLNAKSRVRREAKKNPPPAVAQPTPVALPQVQQTAAQVAQAVMAQRQMPPSPYTWTHPSYYSRPPPIQTAADFRAAMAAAATGLPIRQAPPTPTTPRTMALQAELAASYVLAEEAKRMLAAEEQKQALIIQEAEDTAAANPFIAADPMEPILSQGIHATPPPEPFTFLTTTTT